MKRTIISVRWEKESRLWLLRRGNDVIWQSSRKGALTSEARSVARAHEPSQLRFFGKNGRIQTEHTYPRRSDPRRTKG